MSNSAPNLPPPPRFVRLRWTSIGGPNFQYFLHVILFSLIPILLFLWLCLAFAWAAFGTTVDGHFSYFLLVDSAGGPPKDRMQVDYRLGGQALKIEVSLSHNELRQLGMPDSQLLVPGKPLVSADVPVRVLHVGGLLVAVPLFSETWVWKRMLVPLALTLISTWVFVVLHGEMFISLRRSYRLLKYGTAATGQLTGTHETGWWESTGEYRWTYIRRCYADYVFIGPGGHEYMGYQLVLGEIDPAQWAEGHPVMVLYDARNVNVNVMYEACPLRVRMA
jgi:hypothetical protein